MPDYAKNERIYHLKSVIDYLIGYINVKIVERDWHAVADAAMDIRELEARINELMK